MFLGTRGSPLVRDRVHNLLTSLVISKHGKQKQRKTETLRVRAEVISKMSIPGLPVRKNGRQIREHRKKLRRVS